MTDAANFSALVHTFFTERLVNQRSASAHTIASYRDSFRLLLRFATEQLEKEPSALSLEDLDATFIGQFLDHLEKARGNGARTRNVRLAALRSFFRYVSLCEPEHLELCRRNLAMPNKRADRKTIEFLTRPEIEAFVAAPDTSTWIGRRDRALLLLAIQTGLRVSELIGLRCQDVVLGRGAHVRCRGKGRKERSTPLREEAKEVMESWLRERNGTEAAPVFPSIRGGPLSRDGVERVVARHAKAAGEGCPTLKSKKVSPHVLRQTAAMELLQSGVDRSVIALWLGHESAETTQMYLHADMQLKEKALAHTTPLAVKPQRFRPDDELLTFLESL